MRYINRHYLSIYLSIYLSCDQTGLRPTKTGLGLGLVVGCGLGLGLASLVLVLILVLQLWYWFCIFGLIDKQDHDFGQSLVKILYYYYTPHCCFCITST